MTRPVNTVASVYKWFDLARPNADFEGIMVQTGCHFEEVGEMLEEMQGQCATSVRAIREARLAVNKLAHLLKNGGAKFMVRNDVAFLDSLGDQFVTGIGVGHAMNYEVVPAFMEVDRSNWSKFDADGKPVLHSNGKIAKAPGYTPPQLESFVI